MDEEIEKLSKNLAISNLTKTIAATGKGSYGNDYSTRFGAKKRSLPAGSIQTGLPEIKTFSPMGNRDEKGISVAGQTANRSVSIAP